MMQSTSDNHVTIHGRTLRFDELVTPKLWDQDYVASLQKKMATGVPTPHLVEEGWFNPDLLELVSEEFDLYRNAGWKNVSSTQEHTFRSQPESQFGPACQLYFGIVNSGWFVRTLSAITGITDLITDSQFYGGGLHETQKGGHFGVHRDFDRHHRTGLKNEMVVITYLNKNWQPEWHGGLELWNKDKTACVATVQPEFGRTLILQHGSHSYHGHPHPLSTPDGVTRRSVAAYFYTNPYAEIDRGVRQTSQFIHKDESKKDILRRVVRPLTPPIMWSVVARVLKL